jgi:hypothetical protein
MVPPMKIVPRTGTDNTALAATASAAVTPLAASGAGVRAGVRGYEEFEMPAVWRPRDNGAARGASLEEAGVESRFDIPAFLRKQAD